MRDALAGRIVAGKRLPLVAGLFYEAKAEKLRGQIEWAFRHRLGPRSEPRAAGEPARGHAVLVLPHGGFFLSGPVAALGAAWLSALGRYGLVVVVGPNHTGVGAPVAVYPGGSWVTPLGEVSVDEEASRRLVGLSGGAASLDALGHVYEHSVEVVLPWLQAVTPGFRLVAVSMYRQDAETVEALAEALLGLLRGAGEPVAVVFSANLSSYLPHEEAVEKDRALLDAVLGGGDVFRVVEEREVPTCSPGVLALASRLAGELGQGLRLLGYATSGDVTGEKSLVTGYASLAAGPFPVSPGSGGEEGGEGGA